MNDHKYVTSDELAAYEDGKLSEEEVVDLFQRLVDSGLAWSLQGSYGRTAWTLLAAGQIHSREVRD